MHTPHPPTAGAGSSRARPVAAIAAITVCAALLAACATVPAGIAATPARPARAAAEDRAFHEAAVRIATPDVTLNGVLFTPATPAHGRRPAIVLMHGCGGMGDSRGALTPRHRDWAERFARWGFIALAVDSFASRGFGAICEMKERPIQPWNERSADAYAALAWLVARDDVDARNVFVQGWSNGGSTVMGIVREQAPGRSATAARFKAAIAFYPGCARPLREKGYRPTLPLMILHGEADDWTPAAPCVQLGDKLSAAGLPVRTVVYPGAHHGFDGPVGRVRLLPNVFNPAAPGERGAHVGPHPEARLAAIAEVERFVRRELRR
jgi:dienelactone hydrolase